MKRSFTMRRLTSHCLVTLDPFTRQCQVVIAARALADVNAGGPLPGGIAHGMRYHARAARSGMGDPAGERLMARLSAKRATTSQKRSGRGRHKEGDGDLPTKLLAVTEEILREQGLHKFTLREAARRAGVSHGAPAFHFKDASGLLTAFATEAFEALRELMLRYRAEAPKDARAQLLAVGCAYIDYAISHRSQFQLMFRSDTIRLDDERFKEASRGALQQLQETMAPLFGPDESDAGRAAKLMLAWSAVHGFATLYLEKGFRPFYADDPRPPVAADARRVLELLTASFVKER
jgi:AcrR family transcriptional regulator